MPPNLLYYGDNLGVLREHISDESVDLIYLDPPFNSNQSYNVLFAEQDGTQSAAQIQAFEDTWHWDQGAVEAYQEVVEGGGKASRAMQAFRQLLGDNDTMAYLAMMAPRLKELHRVLKPTGSLYLHCDPTASHYLKVLLDAIFGTRSFRTEIVWKRTTVHSDSKTWSNVSDRIFFYAKTDRFTWHRIYAPHSEEYLESKYRHSENDGRRYTLDNMTSPNPRPNMMYEWKGHASPPKGWRYSRETMSRLDAEGRIWYPSDKSKRPRLKRYLDEMPGTLLGNVWTDINPINSQAAERLGYPTQKPEALLERIIGASSNEGDVVLDPFCGCGTAVASAQKLGRRWVGIDITHLAVNLIRHRLMSAFGEEVGKEFDVIGEPVAIEEAVALAQEDPYQFQWWALSLAGARATEKRKGADHGIDGRIYFHDDPRARKTKQTVFSVKAGKTGVSHVRDLRGVVEREDAAIGVLVTLRKPTRPMRTEAAEAGVYDSPWGKHPRLQLRTIEELMAGKRPDMPPLRQVDLTFRKAPKTREKEPKQSRLEIAG